MIIRPVVSCASRYRSVCAQPVNPQKLQRRLPKSGGFGYRALKSTARSSGRRTRCRRVGVGGSSRAACELCLFSAARDATRCRILEAH